MTIRTMRTVLCRALLGVLADQGFSVFALAKAISAPVADLKRLQEVGSPLDPELAEKLVAWGMRAGAVVKPTKREVIVIEYPL